MSHIVKKLEFIKRDLDKLQTDCLRLALFNKNWDNVRMHIEEANHDIEALAELIQELFIVTNGSLTNAQIAVGQ
jgi:hypothetical protein